MSLKTEDDTQPEATTNGFNGVPYLSKSDNDEGVTEQQGQTVTISNKDARLDSSGSPVNAHSGECSNNMLAVMLPTGQAVVVD